MDSIIEMYENAIDVDTEGNPTHIEGYYRICKGCGIKNKDTDTHCTLCGSGLYPPKRRLSLIEKVQKIFK